MDETTRREWRCWRCDTLLGVEQNGELHVKYKDAQYRVRGVVKATCRRCGAECSHGEGAPREAGRVTSG
jgi:RNase P subunit RPR2